MPFRMIHFGNQITTRRQIEHARPPVSPWIYPYLLQATASLSVQSQREIIDSGAVINDEKERSSRPNNLGAFKPSGPQNDQARG